MEEQRRHIYYELPLIELEECRKNNTRSTTKCKNNIKEITTKEQKKMNVATKN